MSPGLAIFLLITVVGGLFGVLLWIKRKKKDQVVQNALDSLGPKADQVNKQINSAIDQAKATVQETVQEVKDQVNK